MPTDHPEPPQAGETPEVPDLPELSATRPAAGPAGKFNPKTISWWHEALADWMFVNPDRTMKEAAAHFNVTPTYIYMLKNSDTFKAYWERRRMVRENGLIDETQAMLGSINDKLHALAENTLDILNEKMVQAQLQGSANTLPQADLLATADMALKKLGYGIPAPPPPAGTTNVNVMVSSDLLKAAREKMQKLHSKAQILDAVATPVKVENKP